MDYIICDTETGSIYAVFSSYEDGVAYCQKNNVHIGVDFAIVSEKTYEILFH